MQFMQSGLVACSLADLPEDDVDRLFKKLQPHEPPAGIVQQIRARIRRLSAGQQPPASAEPGASSTSPTCADQQEPLQ